MFGWESALELINDALCDVGDDLIEELAEDLVSGDFAASPALVRLGEILREHKSTFENPKMPQLAPVYLEGCDELIEEFLDRAERTQSMREQFK